MISRLEGGDDTVYLVGTGQNGAHPFCAPEERGELGRQIHAVKRRAPKRPAFIHWRRYTRISRNGGREGAARWGASGSGGGAGPVGAARWLSRANANVVATESCAGYVRGETCCGDDGRCATATKCNAPRCEAERAREDGLGRADRGSAVGAMDEGARLMWGALPMRRIAAGSRAVGGTDARRIAAYCEQWFVDGVSGYAPSSAIAGDVRGRIVSQYLQRLHTIACEGVEGAEGFVLIASKWLRGSCAGGIVDMSRDGERKGALSAMRCASRPTGMRVDRSQRQGWCGYSCGDSDVRLWRAMLCVCMLPSVVDDGANALPEYMVITPSAMRQCAPPTCVESRGRAGWGDMEWGDDWVTSERRVGDAPGKTSMDVMAWSRTGSQRLRGSGGGASEGRLRSLRHGSVSSSARMHGGRREVDSGKWRGWDSTQGIEKRGNIILRPVSTTARDVQNAVGEGDGRVARARRRAMGRPDFVAAPRNGVPSVQIGLLRVLR
ncbi:hypothetical protein DFH08DRAFT_931115 [Mycena albidolilacea]|uniref:Uncharacterized protein n=1 Tax=Mycena albidolilacea TaxID=1033008 RepID=A0AAD7AJH3_9AGAR|nr:hypothetical protein DFH08DRAFT_931115 [Mycena albidolilacea]